MSEVDDAGEELPPSKSSRKRAAHALQKLGERLVRMKPEDVATLPLPEMLSDAITEARRLRSHGALSRQYQYIGQADARPRHGSPRSGAGCARGGPEPAC